MNKQYATAMLLFLCLSNTFILATPPQYDEDTTRVIEICRRQSLHDRIATNITGAISDLMIDKTPTQQGIDLLLQLLEDGTEDMSRLKRQKINDSLVKAIVPQKEMLTLKMKVTHIVTKAQWLENNGENPLNYLNKKEAQIAKSYPLNEALALFLLMQKEMSCEF